MNEEYNKLRNEMQKRHQDEQRAQTDDHWNAKSVMQNHHSAELEALNNQRKKLQAENAFHGEAQNEWNRQRSELNSRQRTEKNTLSENQNVARKDLQDKQNKEKKSLDVQYRERSPINKILGYIIGAVIASFVTYYYVNTPSGVEEHCEMVEGVNPTDWAYGWCVLSPVGLETKNLVVFNPGVLGKHSFTKDPFGNRKGVVGGKDHEDLLNVFDPSNMPTIVTFTLYPSKIESIDSAFDERISGTLSLYNKERLYYIKTVVMPKVIFPRLKANRDNNIIMGTSKGGFNAMQLAHEFPLIFNKMILVSPLMTTCDPWGPTSADPLKLAAGILTQNWIMVAMSFSNACMKSLQHPGKEMNANGVISLIKSYYPTKEKFSEADPFKWEYNATWPKTLILSTPSDDFPFFDANYKWYEKLLAAGINIKFKEVVGAHGVFSALKMKEFILE